MTGNNLHSFIEKMKAEWNEAMRKMVQQLKEN